MIYDKIDRLYFPVLYSKTLLFIHSIYTGLGFPCGSVVKNLPAKQEMQVRFLGLEHPLEKEMAAHSSILAWEVPWTEEPGGLQSMGSQRHDIVSKQQHCIYWLLSLIPNFQTSPFPPPVPVAATSLLSMSVTLCFIARFCCILDVTHK